MLAKMRIIVIGKIGIYYGDFMSLKIIKYLTILASICSSNAMGSGLYILFAARSKSIDIKLNQREHNKYWYDGFADIAARRIKNPEYQKYFDEINESVDNYFKFIVIQGGSFDMGSPENEEGRYNTEGVIRNISISDFSMQTTQVTQFQYWLVTKSNPSKFNRRDNCPDEHVTFNRINLCPNHPVEMVSWDDARLFIQKLNKKSDGYTYSLPTEAQWEYSARASTTTRYSFGDDAKDLDSYGWYSGSWYYGNSKSQTHQVASLKPNNFGLSDMHGNVGEWVEDNWSESRERFDIKDDPIFKDSGSVRVVRSGGWGSNPRFLRSARRFYWESDVRSSDLGLRLVRKPN